MIRPSRIINSISGEPYLRRWHLIPRNRWLNVYLHHFVKSDDDRALHDHPWPSVSILLKGELSEVYGVENACVCEHCKTLPLITDTRPIYLFVPVVRRAEHAHRLVLPVGGQAWTLFITGKRVREWGFYCPDGWKWWFMYSRDGGCGERDET